MMSPENCLAKAAEYDAEALLHLDPDLREACIVTANNWRSAAARARQKETWAAAHPWG